MEERGRGRAPQVAGAVLARGGPVGAGLALSAAVAAAVLVPLDLWRPGVAVPVVLVLAVLAIRLSAGVPAPPVPVWTALACSGIAAGHGVWAALTHAEHVVLRRDAGSYAWYTHWIATRGGLPVDARLEAFGGPSAFDQPGFRLASPAFYQVLEHGDGAVTGAHLVPQFLLGSPAWFSFGWWAAGWDGLFLMPALAGALALLAFAGLASRLVGPRWAVLATAVLAIAQPVIHASRSTYSEPLAMLLVLAAAALFVDAVRASGPVDAVRASGPGDLRIPDDVADVRGVRRLAVASGGMLGLVVLFRIDGLREAGLALVVAAVLALRRHPAARPFTLAVLGTTVLAALVAALLSWPYLNDIRWSLVPLVGALVALGLASGGVVVLARRNEGGRQWLPGPRVCAGLLAVVLLGLASRPLWLTVRQDPNDSGSRNVASMQAAQGLPDDGGRTYAEHSVTWMSWYLGWIGVAVAGVVLVVLAHRFAAWWRSGERRVPLWLGPAVVALGSAVLSLYRPSITPDHPWADRRFVPVVLPALVLAAVAGVAWATERLATRDLAERTSGTSASSSDQRWARSAGIVGALVLLVPTWWATAPLAGRVAATERGEPAAVETVCAALRPGDVVLMVDAAADNMWPQVVRDRCGIPTVAVSGYPDQVREWVGPIAAKAAAAGSRPVLMAGETDVLIAELGLLPQKILDLATTEDENALVRRPDGVKPLPLEVWVAPWSASWRPAASG